MHLGWARALALDCGAWAIWGLASGWTLHRVGSDRLDHDTWLTRARRWERGGRTYRRWFRVHRWQRRLPEAGAVFRRGRDKRVVGGRATPVLQMYAAETRRAEYVHWLGVAVAPLFALWNPAGLTVAMVAYAGVANLPCIVSLRANRLRVLGVLARRA
ncbi:MAG: hypothetical protein NVS1B12_16420 [Acidimicrobiales bacterium]